MALFVLALLALMASTSVETPHLKVITSVGTPAGGRQPLFVDVEPKPTMHVYAPGQNGYIVVSLTLEKGAAVAVGPPAFPKAEKIVFEPLNETQLVYTKPFRITQQIRRPRHGPATVKGTLRYQACDDRICYRPTNVPVQWTIN